MIARRIYEAGYHDLVSVVPPDATISPTSSLKDSARGKVPGRQKPDGTWVGYNWLASGVASEDDLSRWEQWGSNVGLLAANYPALDIDCDDPQLAKFVTQEAQRVLGPAPIRTSRPPRRLMVYRTGEPFGRVAATVSYRGREHGVEFLSQGRQYLVAGAHPSGSDYGWDVPLWNCTPAGLTELDAEDALGFLDHLAGRLSGRATVSVVGTGKPAAEDAPPQDSLLAPSLDALRALVDRIPNRFPDRASYIEMGCAIKAAGGEDAYDVFLSWAKRWEHGVNETETVAADWSRMHPPFRVGWGWLRDTADEHSEDYSSAQEEFEVVEGAEPPSEREVLGMGVEGIIAYTDAWTAAQLARCLEDQIRYVPETGQFHTWDGCAWAPDRRNQAEYLVRQELIHLSQVLRERAQAAPAKEERKKLYQAARSLQSRGALTKALPELQAHPNLTLCVEDFDQDDWILNTPEGIVDLRTGCITEPQPDALCAKSTAVGPTADMVPTRWRQFLSEVTQGDRELIRYLQKLTGYSLTGSTQEQILAFVHGPPLTGKTVFIETLAGVFGTYHVTTDANTFANSKGDRHPTDIAALAGARLVTAAETQEGRGWDTQRVKALTGGDEIAARFMRKDFFTYRPRYQIIIVGNHEPEIKGVDAALMRRLHVIPFENRPDSPDRLLFEKLRDEWPGILQWAIDGCQLWLEEGLDPPQVVVDRTEQYRQEEDPIGLFLDECCDLTDPEATISRRKLYRAWARWCHGQGEDPGSLKQLKRRFRGKRVEHGWTDCRVSEEGQLRNGYRGLTLIEDHDPILDGEI